jgi:undecaprenyl diphosphate synthase
MDGNGRWATRRGLPRIAGHQAGRRSVREVVEGCGELGIECLTLFTFSSENWSRPDAEVSALMRFLRQVLVEETQSLADNHVRLETIGRTADLPRQVRRELEKTIERLRGNSGLRLILALSYGGRSELVDCCREIAREVGSGAISPDQIDEALVERHLYTSGIPNPDLLIRTSGEMRLSNFLLWQLAYAEIYVTDTLWPDFRKGDLFRAISEYQNRERRFGRIE